MFTYHRRIHLRETDATGVLYFSEQMSFAVEAFEAYLFSKQMTIQELIEEKEFSLPIVHAETDFLAPLRVGDEVEISLFLGEVGTSSFTMQTRIFDKKRGVEVGTTKIVQVAVSKKTGESIPVPESILSKLHELRVC